MEIDYIIAGQGICGAILSWHLLQHRKTVIAFDVPKPSSASRVASGLINPISGMRLVKVHEFEKLSAYASHVYTTIGQELHIPIIQETSILHFHENREVKNSYHKKSSQSNTCIHTEQNEMEWHSQFNFEHGISEISPCYLVDMKALLDGLRQKLAEKDVLREELFDWAQCKPGADHVYYRDLKAKNVICCNGAEGLNNPYFAHLPFTQNKGEALLVSIPGLERQHIYKKDSIHLIPWNNNLFWAGSSFERTFSDLYPSKQFLEKTTAKLSSWLKMPWHVVGQMAAQRPTTIDRMPFAGCNNEYPTVTIFGGMGTKGCMYAPFYAQCFTAWLLDGVPLPPEINITRFRNKKNNKWAGELR